MLVQVSILHFDVTIGKFFGETISNIPDLILTTIKKTVPASNVF